MAFIVNPQRPGPLTIAFDLIANPPGDQKIAEGAGLGLVGDGTNQSHTGAVSVCPRLS